MAEFAVTGFYGTSTEAIARRAGISQPYVFRLFGSKLALFLAALDRGFDRVRTLFESAGNAALRDGADPLEAIAHAYVGLLGDREVLLGQMQAYAACGEPAVRASCQRHFRHLIDFLESLPGATPARVSQFLASGMLLNVAAAVDFPQLLAADDWAQRFLTSSTTNGD